MTIKEGTPDGSEKKRRGKKSKEDLEELTESSKAAEPQAAPELKGEPLPEEMKVDAVYLAAMELFAKTVREHLEDSLPRIAKMWNAIHIFFDDSNVIFDSVLVEKYDGIASIPLIEHQLEGMTSEDEYYDEDASNGRATPALLLILNGEAEIILYSRVAQKEICILNETDVFDQALWEDQEALKSALARIIAVQFYEQVKYTKLYKELTADDLDPRIANFLRSAVDSNVDSNENSQPAQPKKRVRFTKKKKK